MVEGTMEIDGVGAADIERVKEVLVKLAPAQAQATLPLIDQPSPALPAEHILQFFAYDHLPMELKQVSHPFAVLANEMVVTLPRNPERTVALRKLLEAKDAAVRAKMAK